MDTGGSITTITKQEIGPTQKYNILLLGNLYMKNPIKNNLFITKSKARFPDKFDYTHTDYSQYGTKYLGTQKTLFTLQD